MARHCGYVVTNDQTPIFVLRQDVDVVLFDDGIDTVLLNAMFATLDFVQDAYI